MQIRLNTGKAIPVSRGENVLDALNRAGVFITASCGGKGTCGKCKVRLLEGRVEQRGTGKLTGKDRQGGLVLACQSYPQDDVSIEIPETSRLVVGEKIAASRARALEGLFASFGVEIKPIVKTLDLHLPPPTLHDNISDLDRLRRALEEQGITGVRFSHGFARSMAQAMRTPGWRLTLGYTDGPEAIFIRGREEKARYGLAVDIGTTTVVVYLVDLISGGVMDVGSTYNSQLRYGDDVITRIVHATEGDGLEELREAVTEDINDLTAVMLSRHATAPSDVESVAVAGNTTMMHLFWGLDPGYIREEPYIPTINSFPLWKAGTARLRINPQAPVYTLPCVASYVGGDIVAGVLATKMHRKDEIALFMDIGTNGEIVLGNSEWLVAAACSAGPCFEGSGIRHGMRATEGAIEGVKIDPAMLRPELTVIGGGAPAGICGSGMIDAIAEMFLRGVIDQRGKLKEGVPSVREEEEGLEYVLYDGGGRPVTLTETDIENVLRAKAAMHAGVSLLLREMGLEPEAIERIYIAGGFGNYLNVERAITLGMLPDLPRDRFSFMGNTSAAGAYLTLLSEDLRREAEAIASKMTYVELSVSRGYMDEYMSSLFLPHTDMGRFPTVKRLMAGEGK